MTDVERAETSAEEASLRAQITHLRAELEREATLYGELKAQAARHQAIARDALARLEESQLRERSHLRALGVARARATELEADAAAARPPAVKRRVTRAKKVTPPPARRSRRAKKRMTKPNSAKRTRRKR